MIDCLTLFARAEAYPSVKPVRLTNPLFMGESKIIKHFQSPYSRLTRDPAPEPVALAATG